MIPIKIRCSCGQKFAFDVEPVNGRVPSAVTCPACGRAATEAANEQIRLQLARSAPPAPPKKGKTLLIVGLCAGALVLLLLAAVGALIFLKVRSAVAVAGQTTSSSPAAQGTHGGAEKPAKVERDPSFVAVGAMFDRNLKTRHVEITRVLNNSPAKNAGIVAGDILISVDDTPIEDLRLKEIVEMVYGPLDSKITMEVISSQTGQTNRVEMVRKKFHR